MSRMRSIPATIVAIAVVAVLAAAVQDEPGLVAGQKAPDFTLPDLDGKERSLSDYAGKVVVMEWTNPSCPYSRRCYRRGLVQETLEAMKKMGKDFVYLAINSTADVPREQVVQQSRTRQQKHDLEFPVLIDYDGKVGKRYDARTTPHMFIIDAEGVVRYQGAFTDDPFWKKDAPTNFVIQALEQIRAGRKVEPDYDRPWGCSVKYKR
jgi:peroxiredoxin